MSRYAGKLDARSLEARMRSLERRAGGSGRPTVRTGISDRIAEDVARAHGLIDSQGGDQSTLEGRVSTLESDMTALEARVGTIESDLAALEARVTTLEGHHP